MKVAVTLSSYTFVGDLSGAEVEVLSRCFGKLQRGTLVTMDQHEDTFVLDRDWKSGLKITTVDVELRSQGEVDDARKEKERKSRAALVVAYFEAPHQERADIAKSLQNQLYYDGFIAYSARESWHFEHVKTDMATNAEAVVFAHLDGTASLEVSANGTVTLR